MNLAARPPYSSATMPAVNLEQLAQITEPQMVRTRFDEQNLVWAYLISWLFALASLVLVPASFAWKQQRVAHASVSIIDALLTLLLLAAMSELRRVRRRENRPMRPYARIIARNLSAWLIALFAVKFAALVFFALSDKSGWAAWGSQSSLLYFWVSSRYWTESSRASKSKRPSSANGNIISTI